MIFVWERGGTRREATMLPDGSVARLSYEVLEIFWFFGYAINLRWELVGRDPENDVPTTREAIEAEYSVVLSEPGIWKRYGIFITIIAVVMALTFRWALRGA